MFFNRQASLLALVLLGNLLGCTPKIGEKPPDPVNIELGVSKCLTKSAQDLKAFFAANVSEADLTRAWSCVEAAFYQFDKYVVGQEKDRYTSQEVVDFLERNFFENQNSQTIHKELQVEFMKLKQIFVGGSRDYVTRDELKRSQSFVREISRMTVTLNPFMNIVVMAWKPDLDSGRNADLDLFEKSNLATQVFARELAQLFKVHDSKYNLSDIIKLVKELEKFFNEDWTWVSDFEKLLPAAQKLKKSLAGGTEDVVTNQEWPPVLTLGARGYYQYLRYFYFIKPTPQTGGGIRLVYVARTLEDVFSILQDLLIEKQSGSISKQELYEILAAFELVWPELKVSENLILEFMKIKQVLVGGSIENWTANDFEKARLKVPELRRIVENFLSYYGVYSFEWEPESDGVERSRKIFEEARNRLYVVGQDISRFLQASYSFKDFYALISEIEKLYPPKSQSRVKTKKSNSRGWTEKVKKYESLVIEINKTLFNRNDSVIEEKSWPVIVPLAARFYSLYQYYSYFLTDKSLKQTQPLQDFGVIVDHGLTFLTDFVKATPGSRLSEDELVSLVMAAVKAGFLPENLSEASVRNLVHAVLQHFLFDPERRLKGEQNRYFSTDQLSILRQEFRGWLLPQLAINQMFENSPETSFPPLEFLKKLKERIQQTNDDAALKLGLSEVFVYLDAAVSQTHDSEEQLQISNKVDWSYRLNSAFMANLNRFLARLLIRSFSTEKTLTKLIKCDAEKAFGLLVGSFRDLGIFDPKPTFISSRFLEANIFMIRANGDKFIDTYELSELLAVVFSGLKVNDKLESSLRNVCPIQKDQKGQEFITFKCMSQHHYTAVRKHMQQMPEFKKYVDQLAAKVPPAAGFVDWNIVFRATFKATGWEPNQGYGNSNQESVYIADILYYPFIVNYLEYIFARFDTTKNGAIQVVEARRAYPVFKPLLKDLAKDQLDSGSIKESDLLAVFTYILKYKEQPDSSGVGNILKWLWWKANPDSWDLWVTRTEMSQILGYIAEKAGELPDESSSPEETCKR